MTIVLQNVPADLEAELMQRAKTTGQSLDEITLDAVRNGLSMSGLDEHLQSVIGTWVPDPQFDAAIADFERVDQDQWQ